MLGRTVEYAMAVEGREDRVAVFERDQGIVVALADGAGGTSGGAAAAQAFVSRLANVEWSASAHAWINALTELDGRVGPGQTTAIALATSSDGFAGASVGDSQAWWFSQERATCLTSSQIRKPLLGNGDAAPIGISLADRNPGTLVVASDGLWNYAPLARIASLLTVPPREAAPALIEAVRYPGGQLPDDVAVAVIRLGAGRST